MKNFVLGMIFTVAVFIVGALAYLLLGFAEVRGDVPGTHLESRLLAAAVRASVRRHAPELANPFPPSDETLVAGGKIFLNECAGCHGTPGKATDSSGTLYPPAPQLPKVGTQYTEAQIFWIAKYGIRRTGMFANGKWESDEKLWKAAAYIKRIKDLPPPVEQAVAKMAAGN